MPAFSLLTSHFSLGTHKPQGAACLTLGLQELAGPRPVLYAGSRCPARPQRSCVGILSTVPIAVNPSRPHAHGLYRLGNVRCMALELQKRGKHHAAEGPIQQDCLAIGSEV